MRRTIVLACALAVAVIAPAAANAAERMLIGFQDDPSFRWREDRAAALDQAQSANAGIVRTNVYWSRIAPTRPTSASDPFDPAYRFDDLDEFVRNTQARGIEVMFTIWGTPTWANGGRGQNHAPTRYADLTAFARALASRYSGTFPGLPFVHYFTVWNEPNLEQFLAPTFDKHGKPASPFTYAKIYRAAYAGIKAGNPKALVGIGETSPRGRDRLTPKPGKLQNTLSPGKFAQLLSTVRPALRFDAWAHHPYSELGRSPLQKVAFPNVNLTQLPTFETKLEHWFHRKHIRIWITEYGFETKPAERKGVTVAQQAAYVRRSLEIARQDPHVQIYIWFIFRDDPTSTWQSGMLNEDGTRKPALASFTSLAKLLDGRNPIVSAHVGKVPTVRIPVLELAARDGVGATLGATLRIYTDAGKFVESAQLASKIDIDGYASFVFGKSSTAASYTVLFEINDKNGNRVDRYATVIYSK
jgi:hypothetical protein